MSSAQTLEQLGYALGELSNRSSLFGFIYGLLSWEVFRRIEERLIQVDGLSPKNAAKHMSLFKLRNKGD
jgi:hypothetical protein